MDVEIAKQRTFDRAWSEIDATVAVIEILCEVEGIETDEFLCRHGEAIRERMDLESVGSVTGEPGFVKLTVRFPKWTLTFTDTSLTVDCS